VRFVNITQGIDGSVNSTQIGEDLFKEVLQIIEELIQTKKCKLVLIKQNLHLDPGNRQDMTNKVLLTIFSMVAELERDFISERTKEGLRAKKEMGSNWGKPKGVIQRSIYDKDKEKILHLCGLGVPWTPSSKLIWVTGNTYHLKNLSKKGSKIIEQKKLAAV
jgi:DNA invertase Pin-like site-specific DNA recombinase